MTKPTIPEVLGRFAAYRAKHPAWGCLHVVLDDPNYLNSDVAFCMKLAKECGDAEGYELACILMQMSKTQRIKIAYLAESASHANQRGDE